MFGELRLTVTLPSSIAVLQTSVDNPLAIYKQINISWPDFIYMSLVIKSLCLDYVDHCSNSFLNNTVLPVTLSSSVVPKKIFITRFINFCIEIHFCRKFLFRPG